MKYFLILFFTFTTQCFAQDFKTQTADFRKKYESDFLTDKSSPLKQDDLKYLRYYEPDSSYRVIASVEFLHPVSTFVIPTFSGAGANYVKYALAKFTIDGKPQELTLYKSITLDQMPAYKNYLFLPFTDATNARDTYAGGRYIDMSSLDIKDGKLVIDFNKAYNPYCAFATGYACPKPPEENNLTVAIKAGEKKFAKEVGH
jgi:uncharacterized protein (DUF1684 family)